jgi:TPR repeat protein
MKRNGRSGPTTQLDHSRRRRLRFGLLAVSCALVCCLRQGPHVVTTPTLAPALPTPTVKAGFVIDGAPNALIAQGDAALKAKDYVGAQKSYEEASKDADGKVQGSALNRLGELYAWGFLEAQDSRAKAFGFYQRSAALGNAYGAANLGSSLFFGQGTSRNLPEAFRWAPKGAEAGVPEALNQLGWQYLDGMGVVADIGSAKQFYARSAALGDPLGEAQLGWIYGHVAPIDYAVAMKWYKKAAEQHQDMAENNLGFLYENGLGVTLDYAEAARWYQMAADSGYARAQFHLGVLYAQGRGVPKDVSKARELIEQASQSGDEAAAEWIRAH